jgi:hypothetical protein
LEAYLASSHPNKKTGRRAKREEEGEGKNKQCIATPGKKGESLTQKNRWLVNRMRVKRE